MKKTLFVLVVAGFVLDSCGSEKKDQDNVSTHIHEDGTVHEDGVHDIENEVQPNQESFEVEIDSAASQAEEHNHKQNEEYESHHP